ncbi:MAG: hypothetical protein RR879_06200 [Hydrogenoanaerobacterium sp.]
MPKLMVIIDGAADGGDKISCGETLLQMKKSGAYGFFKTTPQGFCAESLTCIATLLGVPPQSIPQGRAYAEALSCGAAVGDNDAVFRCSLVTVGGDGCLASSCAEGAEDKMTLCKSFAEGFNMAGASFINMSGYKNLLILRGAAKAAVGIKTFAPHEHIGEPFEALLPCGADKDICTALCTVARKNIGNTASGAQLAMLPWGMALKQALPKFEALHGIKGAAVCATEVMRGIAVNMGLHLVTPMGANAESDTNLTAKAEAALGLLNDYEFVLVHINGADELSHRRDAQGKAAFLKRVDDELLELLLKKAPKGTAFLVCSDHSSLCKTGAHGGEAQPFVLYGGAYGGYMGEHDGTEAVELLLRGK